MNKLPVDKKIQIVEGLVNGLSLNAISIVADVSINTITKLQMNLGKACIAFHDRKVRQLQAIKEVFCNAVWSFPGMTGKTVRNLKLEDVDNIWTFMATDKDSKLILSYIMGTYQSESALTVLRDVNFRVKSPYNLTSDSTELYLSMTEQASDKVGSKPVPDSKFFVLGLSSMLQDMKPTDRFVLDLQQDKLFKKMESFYNALSLHVVYHNFVKKSELSGATLAMRAGLTEKPLGIADFVRLHDQLKHVSTT